MLRLSVVMLIWFSGSVLAACPQLPPQAFLAIKAQQFTPALPTTPDQLALTWLDCLAEPNPVIRDQVVFEGYQHWLRQQRLSPATRDQLLQQVLVRLATPAADSVAPAFYSLLLAELVRVDRLTPYLSEAQRAEIIQRLVQQLKQVQDYRGFDAEIGWRHLVAHTADVMLQWALNPALTQVQASEILAALASQLAPSNHFYHFGEPKRLAMPMLYLYLQGQVSESQLIEVWQRLVQRPELADPARLYQSEASLAVLHNVRSHLQAVYVMCQLNDEPKLKALLPALTNLLKQLPG